MIYQALRIKQQPILVFAICCLLSVSWMGCEKIKTDKKPPKTEPVVSTPTIKGTVIAKVNNIILTLEDLNREIDDFNRAVESSNRPEMKITTQEAKINYLKTEMLRRALLYQEAMDRGLERNDEVIANLERNKRDILVGQLIKQEVEKIEVTPADIDRYYQDYKEQPPIKEPEERQIREILLPTEQEAKDLYIQILQGADVATLAKAQSRAETAKDGGDLGFISRGTKASPQFDNVAFSDGLDVGKISNIFKAPEGYYILKLEAKRGGRQKPLSEVRDYLEQVIKLAALKNRIEDLANQLYHNPQVKIEIYDQQIK